jgi:cytochrome c556
MHRPLKTAAGVSFAAVAMLMMLFVSLRAQQPPAPAGGATPATPAAPGTPAAGTPAAPAGRGAAPAAPAAKPLVPVATNTIAANPDAFYGQAVTITASVEQILSRSSFTVDQRRVGDAPAPKQPTDVLVLVPTIQRPVDLKSYVTVMGELMKFDPAEVAKKAKDYKIDLPPDAAAKYAGRPVLIATSVINDKFDDVAKRLPPPLNAEEEAFQKVMRAVGPAAAALRPAVDSSNAEVATKNAAILQKGFADTEAFWKPKKTEPTLWAQNARKEVEAVQTAIAAGKWDDAKAHAATVAQACGQCHGVYRERFDDGSFRVKK